jgi:hypothetical protein
MALRWDFFVNTYDTHRYHPTGLDGRENKHIAYVREFASAVSILQVCCFVSLKLNTNIGQRNQDKTNSLIDVYKEITRLVEELSTCSFTTEALSELLSKIQAAVSSFALLMSTPPLTFGT